MAQIPDPRLDAARRGRRREEGHARRGPRRRRARNRRRRCSGTCARSMRCSPSSTAGPGRAILPPISRRSSSSCSLRTATTSSGGSSGSRNRRSRATRSCGSRWRSSSRSSRTSTPAGRSREWERELPGELDPLTTKPLLAVENGPGGIDAKLEAELAELSDEEAAEFRDGRVGARGDSATPLRGARPRHVLHRGREGDARVDAAARAARHSTPRRPSTPTSRAGSSAAR